MAGLEMFEDPQAKKGKIVFNRIGGVQPPEIPIQFFYRPGVILGP